MLNCFNLYFRIWKALNMKVWLAHIFYTCLGNFKSCCFVFPIIIPLVNEGLQNYLIDGRVVPKIGFARLFN